MQTISNSTTIKNIDKIRLKYFNKNFKYETSFLTDSDTEMLFGIEFNQKHVVSTLYKLLSMFAAYKMQTFFSA